jgi:hypothetical protein
MDEEWLSSRQAIDLVKTSLSLYLAPLTICARANDGLIEARAKRLVVADRLADNVIVPIKFWWARGEAALRQNWQVGDFETWIREERGYGEGTPWRAYGVEFRKVDIFELLPSGSSAQEPTDAASIGRTGRPPAEWWDDMWIEICRQLYAGDLKPHRQADIETAMLEWIEVSGNSAAISTVRPRARKLWTAISTEDKN